MTFRDIEFSVDDPVAIVRLNRPEQLNAFTYDTLREIRAAINGVTAGGGLILALMSDRIDAETALRIGLVESVVAPDALPATACNYIRRLAVTSSPAAVAETKRLLYRHLGTGYVEALREADAAQWKFVAAPDALEGAAALLGKRPPKFARLGAGE